MLVSWYIAKQKANSWFQRELDFVDHESRLTYKAIIAMVKSYYLLTGDMSFMVLYEKIKRQPSVPMVTPRYEFIMSKRRLRQCGALMRKHSVDRRKLNLAMKHFGATFTKSSEKIKDYNRFYDEHEQSALLKELNIQREEIDFIIRTHFLNVHEIVQLFSELEEVEKIELLLIKLEL